MFSGRLVLVLLLPATWGVGRNRVAVLRHATTRKHFRTDVDFYIERIFLLLFVLDFKRLGIDGLCKWIYRNYNRLQNIFFLTVLTVGINKKNLGQ